MEQAVATFALDLRGLSILTEAASGYFALTPFLASLGGADRVFALLSDSKHGTIDEIRELHTTLAREFGGESRIEYLTDRTDSRIGQADIVTNLGFVRPIDRDFLDRCKSTVVIPLMWETWEFRPEDLDLTECRRRHIPVLGTNEHHPDLQIFDYIGCIALKALFHMEVEVLRSSIIVLGSGEFADSVIRQLTALGARIAHVIPGQRSTLAANRELILNADAMVVVEHQERKELIGQRGMFQLQDFFLENSRIPFIHICGGVDQEIVKAAGVRCFPENGFAHPGNMSLTTAFVGPKPLVDLHAAGLKVGEVMSRARIAGLTGKDLEGFVCQQTSLAQRFAE